MADGADDTGSEDRGDSDAGTDRLLALLDEQIFGERPSLTRLEVAAQAGVPPERAAHLWHLLGFAQADDDAVAFFPDDVRALQHVQALNELGLLDREQEDGLVRSWARSFARMAEWQSALLAEVAVARGIAPAEGAATLGAQVLPRMEELQSFVWRRHLVHAAARQIAALDATSADPGAAQAVCFVDIVGYTSRSKELSDRELVAWLEAFESTALGVVVAHGGRIIKNIGDELLVLADTAADAAAIALELTTRGEDEDDPFPRVRAGVAYGAVVLRLGDVFGPVVNIAARLTSVARPGTVLIDEGMFGALTGRADPSDPSDPAASAASAELSAESEPDAESPEDNEPHEHYRFRRLRRLSVKGYSRLRAWSLSAR